MVIISDFDEYLHYSDDSSCDGDFEASEYTFEDYCDLNSKELLNTWFLLQENAQILHSKEPPSYNKFCEFMYNEYPEQDILNDTEELMTLWKSIGMPKTFYEFYIFYNCK
jgi:hypothetical protein